MGRYNFKGDVGDASPRQLDYIEEVLQKRGIKGPDVTLETVGAAGDNYMASVKRIAVNNDEKVLKMIVKFAPRDPLLRLTANTGPSFRNEHCIYTEVLPKFRQLQIDADLQGDDLYRFPECYGSLVEEAEEVIVLEDLNESQFVMLDRFKKLNNECVRLVLKNFAIFHSLSFVLKHQEPETYSALKNKFENVFSGPKDEMSKQYFDSMETTVLQTVQENAHKIAFKGTLSNMNNLAAKVKKAAKDSKHAVIRQGDGWTNNILFRMENELPLELVIIDYQLAYESSPVYDIMYFLFNSTDHEQRHQHFYGFIDYYYDEFEKSLQHYGLKANFLYSRDHLDADLKRYGKYLLAMGALMANIITKNNEDALKLKDSFKEEMSAEKLQLLNILNPETAMVYKKKLEDLADSFIEFRLL